MAASRRGKKYSGRSKRSRANIDRIIKRDELDRQKALRDLREGNWTPYARNKAKRAPNAVTEALRDDAMTRMLAFQGAPDIDFARWEKFNEPEVRANIGKMSAAELKWTISASDEDIIVRSRNAVKGGLWYYH